MWTNKVKPAPEPPLGTIEGQVAPLHKHAHKLIPYRDEYGRSGSHLKLPQSARLVVSSAVARMAPRLERKSGELHPGTARGGP